MGSANRARRTGKGNTNISGRERGGTSRFTARRSERQHAQRDPNQKSINQRVATGDISGLRQRFPRGGKQIANGGTPQEDTGREQARSGFSGVSGTAFRAGGRRTRSGIRIPLS